MWRGRGEPPNTRWYVVAPAQAGQISATFRKDRRSSFLGIFFAALGFAAAWGESELSSKADMTDAIGEFRSVPPAEIDECSGNR
jgi:hypothetical protein